MQQNYGKIGENKHILCAMWSFSPPACVMIPSMGVCVHYDISQAGCVCGWERKEGRVELDRLELTFWTKWKKKFNCQCESPSSMLHFPQIDRQAHQSRISFFHCLCVSFSCVSSDVVVFICLSSKRDGRENERLDFVNCKCKEMTERRERKREREKRGRQELAQQKTTSTEKRGMMTKVII